jgi:hypothetical protein
VSRELAEAKLQLVLVDFVVESWQHASQVLNEITLRLKDDSNYRRARKHRNSGTGQIHAVQLHMVSFKPNVGLGIRLSRS